MTILSIAGKEIKLGYTKMLIKNISKGGLCFISNIRIPINTDTSTDILLRFKIKILGQEIKINVSPIWREEVGENLYEIGIKFKTNKNEAKLLNEVIEELQIKKENNIEMNEKGFISKSPSDYFKEILKSN